MGLRERIRNLFRLLLLLAVLITVALISAITTIRFAIQGRQENMPNFRGISLEQAQRMASTIGVGLKVEDKLFDAKYPAGTIVSQEPPPGTRIKVGQHIHVLVSLGPPQVVVPNTVGTSLRAARITAVQRGLAVGDVATIHWPGSEPDQVLAQDPPPSTTDVRSPAVNLLVSLGDPVVAYLCPSFVGKPLAEARRAIENAGFKVGDVVSIPDQAATKDTILSQSPSAGSKIGQDAVFTFQVASGTAPPTTTPTTEGSPSDASQHPVK
jgi:beta-lactam-binding protein with PASTA domain